MKPILSFLFLLLALGACKSDMCKDAPSVAPLKEKVSITRLEAEVDQIKTKEDAKEFLDRNRLFSSQFLRRSEYPHDSLVVNMILKLANDKGIDTLTRDCNKIFDDLTWLQNELDQSFAYIAHYFPDFKTPKIYTIVTGFGTDLFVSDSLIVIGLDYFVNDSSKYRPDVPEYIYKRFKKEYIAPSISLLISDKYNRSDMLDNSLMAEMIHYGKAYYFVEKMHPCINDTLIIGYTGRQYLDTEKHKEIVWAYFVQNKIFFETSHFIVNKYIGERPITVEIGNKCPGRIGRWLGWQIVRKYMKEQNLALPDLMALKDARKLFNDSGYRP